GGRAHEVHQFRLRELENTVRVDQQVAIRRGDVDGSRCGPVAVRRFLHPQCRRPGKDLRHQAAMVRIDVLDDDDDDPEIRRKRRQPRGDGIEAAWGSRDSDDVISGNRHIAIVRPWLLRQAGTWRFSSSPPGMTPDIPYRDSPEEQKTRIARWIP